jgi:hypothetical protein
VIKLNLVLVLWPTVSCCQHEQQHVCSAAASVVFSLAPSACFLAAACIKRVPVGLVCGGGVAVWQALATSDCRRLVMS